MNREATINQIFDNLSSMKRGLAGRTHSFGDGLILPNSQLELLNCVKHDQPISFKDLAKQMYLTPGAVSQLVDGLEKNELLLRQTDPHDRRIQRLTVTKFGNHILQQAEIRRRDFMDRVMRDLDTDELNVWLRVQQKMLEQLQIETQNNTKMEPK